MSRKILLLLTLTFINISSLYADNQEFKEDSILARTLYVDGITLAQKLLYQDAIILFKNSLIIREKIYGKNSYESGTAHTALGINYKNIGNLEKSIEHYLLAEKAYLNEANLNETVIARLYLNIGNVYKIKLSFEIAKDYFQRAINIYNRAKGIDKEDIAEIYYNLAEVYYKQNDYQKVIEISDQHLFYAYDDTRILFMSLRAASLNGLRRIDEANKAYQVTINLAKEFYTGDDINVLTEYLNYINFLISVYKFQEADSILKYVEDIFITNNAEKNLMISFFYKTKGTYYEYLTVESDDLGNFRKQKAENLYKALQYYQAGLSKLGLNVESLDDMMSFENSISITQSLSLLKSIADIYSSLSDIYNEASITEEKKALESALKYYNYTARFIQQSRKSMYSDEDKIQLAELEEATFYKMIEIAYRAFNLDPNHEFIDFAFENAERIKASTIYDRLSDQLAKENSLIPDSLTERELTLNYKITEINEVLFNLRQNANQDESEIHKADSVLFELKKQRDELNQFLENNYLDYYNMKYSNSMISVKDIQRNLKNNEVLIEYVLNETDTIPQLYAFVVTNNHTNFNKLNVPAEFIPSIEETFRFVSNPAYLFTRNYSSRTFCILAHSLHQTLIAPYADLIQKKKIIIIPDGKLNYLPFETLLTELPDTSGLVQFHNLPYLIRTNTINYSYSANLMFKFKKMNKQAKNKLLALAPDYNSDTIHFDTEKLVLLPLPGIQREVDFIAKEIKTKLFKGVEASEKNFREESKNHDILHLAMHAFINDSLPAFSRLAFAQNLDTLSGNDGWLNTADIYNLDLNARLTVLSACNTGKGTLRKGEGVMSLARGFIYAGCPSIVMSLWEVEDNAGTEIMHSFYKVLKKGRNTDDALRQAKLQYLENANPRTAHPHYWLGYVSIGNTEPLFRSYDFYFFGFLILALAGLAADQIRQFKKSGKRRYQKN